MRDAAGLDPYDHLGYGRIRADMAATSGVHEAEDVIKLLMVGASVTMLCSALQRRSHPHRRARRPGMDGNARIQLGTSDARQHGFSVTSPTGRPSSARIT
jgi:hypothetical protein